MLSSTGFGSGPLAQQSRRHVSSTAVTCSLPKPSPQGLRSGPWSMRQPCELLQSNAHGERFSESSNTDDRKWKDTGLLALRTAFACDDPDKFPEQAVIAPPRWWSNG
jgi:hypothetical protein